MTRELALEYLRRLGNYGARFSVVKIREAYNALSEPQEDGKPLAVVEGWIPLGIRGRDAARMFRLLPYIGASESVTVTVTKRKP